jgi:hypothetical protein
MNSTLEKRIGDFIKENRDDIVRDIGALVAIPSVAGEPAEGAPFGKASRQALDKGLEIAARLGLDTRNCGNMIGWAELAGEGEGQVYRHHNPPGRGARRHGLDWRSL